MPKDQNQNSSTQINDPKNLEILERAYEDIVFEDRVRQAFDLSKNIENTISKSNLQSINPELFNRYKNIIIKLKWLALPWLSNQKVVDLFKNHFTKIFEIEFFDVWEKFKKKLLALMLLEERDELKNQIKNVLLLNQEKITSQKLASGNPPTIANWLKDYAQALGNGPVNRVKQSEYLTNNQNIRTLSEPEKNKLKILFNIFERTKLSSSTIEGIEESIPVDEPGNEGEIIEGRFIKYKDKDKIIANLKRMQAIIEGREIETEVKPEEEVAPGAVNYHQTLQKILTQSNLKLPDKNLTSRFRNIILSRLRNVRSTVTTREVLIRPSKVGGLGLAEAQADKIIKIIEAQAKNIHASKKALDSEQKPQDILDKIIAPTYSLEKSVKEKPNQVQLTSKPKPDLTASHELEPPEKKAKLEAPEFTRRSSSEAQSVGRTSHISGPKPIKLIPKPRIPAQPQPRPITMQEIKPPVKKPSFASISQPKPQPRPQPSTIPSKHLTPSTKLESIQKQPSRITGEVEEIANLKLSDFRRWSTEPEESAARIKDKIETIEKESLVKKAAAIRAWQNSEINRLYLAIGRTSMEQGKPVEQIIKERQAEGKPFLTFAEFDAIADLNEELRF